MITNKGQSIIGKYLLGHAPSYASHIAIGCGARPYKTSDSVANTASKTALDFEMFRVPISSRGFVSEEVNGQTISKIVLTAELPSEERYEFSELGLFSAGFNESAGNYDSKMLFSFSNIEGWRFYNGTSLGSAESISTHLGGSSALDIIQSSSKAIETNVDNAIFFKDTRTSRYERGRFLNNIILLRGDSSNISLLNDRFSVGSGAQYLQKTGSTVNLSGNSMSDEIRTAFVVVNKDGSAISQPKIIRLLIEFSVDGDSSKSARIEQTVVNGTGDGQYDLSVNRYCVVKTPISNVFVTPDFNWNAANTVKIYTTILNQSNAVSNQYYVLLDGIRLENLTSENALYGLTGYSVIQNPTGAVITKDSNTNNYVEFRFALGVA
jgi:hypothetical protein